MLVSRVLETKLELRWTSAIEAVLNQGTSDVLVKENSGNSATKNGLSVGLDRVGGNKSGSDLIILVISSTLNVALLVSSFAVQGDLQALNEFVLNRSLDLSAAYSEC